MKSRVTLSCSRTLVLLVAFAMVVGFDASAGSPQGGSEKSILVTVLDESGAPMKALTAADFVVREDNVVREVTGAKLATDPLFVALLIDTAKPTEGVTAPTRELRAG